MTGIQWTDETWNPTTGCDRISEGCDHCYALTLAKRLKAMGQAKYQNDGDPRTSGPGFALTMHPDSLGIPLRWRDPRMVFVNSMSDLGHARVSRDFAERVWAVMACTPRHTYQILSKRPDRMCRLLADECRCGAGHAPGVHFRSGMEWAATSHSETYVPGLFAGIGCNGVWPLPNVWMGTSIELDRHVLRADALRETPAAVRFLSLEPLIGPLPSLSFEGIDWTIIGGESGPEARPLDLGWVRDLADRAREAGSAVFVKQMGAVWARAHGADSHGGDWSFWPEDLRIRQFPERVTAGAA